MRQKRKVPILKLGGVRNYTKIDAVRAFIGTDDTVYGFRATNQRKLVKINSDNSVLDLYTFSKPCQGGFRTSTGVLLVSCADRIGAQHNFPSEIWRSGDNGANFTKVLDITAGGAIYWSFAEDSHGNLFVSEYGYKYSNDGNHARYVHKSTDGGITWNACFDTGAPYDSHIHCIAVDPFDDSLYVSVGDTATREIWRSADSGENWTQISSTRQPISIIFLAQGILWGSDDHTGEITLMKRGTWEETIVYTHENNESMFYAMTKDANGNIYAHAHDDSRPGLHYTVIGSPDLSVWRDLDYQDTFSMSPFLNGKAYCDGYVMTSETTEKYTQVRN